MKPVHVPAAEPPLSKGTLVMVQQVFTDQGERVIAFYQSLLELSGEMLEAAKASDWETLSALEEKCRKLLAHSIATEGDQTLSLEQRIRKSEIIRRMLTQDAEIRKLAIEGMERLEQVIGALVQHKKLQTAYRAPKAF